MRTLICCLLLSGVAFATGNTCVSAQSGSWNVASTWTSCGSSVPGPGDVARISNAHTVDIPSGYQAIIGNWYSNTYTHGIATLTDGLPALSCTADNGTGILTVHGTLTFRGHVAVCNASWTAYAGAILEHDSSGASSPSATHYRWPTGMAFRPTAQTLIRGVSGNRVIVRNATGSGTFYGFTYDGNGSPQNSGSVDFSYATISGCGGASTNCIDGASYSGAFVMRCDHCLVTNSGQFNMRDQGGDTSASFLITNTTITSSANSTYTVMLVDVKSPHVILDTIYTDGQIWLNIVTGQASTDTHFRNVVTREIVGTVNYPITFNGSTWRINEFDRYLRITDTGLSTGHPAYLPGGTLTRTMCVISGNYPHCFQGPVGDGVNPDVVDGGYLEKNGGGSPGTGGHGYLGPPTSSTAALTTIKNVIVACATDNGYGVSLSSNAISPTYLKTFFLNNNTYCGKYTANDGTSRGFGFELAYTAPAGMLQGLRNNIVFSNTPSDVAYIVHTGATGTPGAGTFANVDYNWKWNVGTGPYQYAPNAYYAPNPPGSHDSTGDPQFVQQRHFLDWCQMLKPAIGTWTDCVAEFAKMNDDSGYDQRFTILNAYNWLRAGYVPQNPAVYTAGDTGGQVGAMNLIPSKLAGPGKTAGPGVVK
jgi:hypothetical protein